MNTERTNIGTGFWLQWVLASMLGFAAGAAMGNAVTDWAFTALFGAVGGFMQWLVLRRQIAAAGWWVLASALGFAIAPIAGVMAMSQIMSLDGNPMAAPILLGVLFGVLSAIMPWLVLRRQLARAGWWVPAHLLGSLVGGAMGIVAFHVMALIGFYQFPWAAAGAMFGAGLGAVTGITLVWLLRQPIPGKQTGRFERVEVSEVDVGGDDTDVTIGACLSSPIAWAICILLYDR